MFFLQVFISVLSRVSIYLKNPLTHSSMWNLLVWSKMTHHLDWLDIVDTVKLNLSFHLDFILCTHWSSLSLFISSKTFLLFRLIISKLGWLLTLLSFFCFLFSLLWISCLSTLLSCGSICIDDCPSKFLSFPSWFC